VILLWVLAFPMGTVVLMSAGVTSGSAGKLIWSMSLKRVTLRAINQSGILGLNIAVL
jgi:hypothetical protein